MEKSDGAYSHKNTAVNPEAVIQAVLPLLLKAYPGIGTRLHYRSPFELAVGVILSAQCTDDQVNKITPKLFKAFATSRQMMQASEQEIQSLIYSAGFYRNKTKSLLGMSRMLEEQFHGHLPDTMEDLLLLPGIGRKSANLLLGIVYHKPAVIVDTHVIRVSNRLGFAAAKNPYLIELQIKKSIPLNRQTEFSTALNRHGRECCTSRNPQCSRCPVDASCSYYACITLNSKS